MITNQTRQKWDRMIQAIWDSASYDETFELSQWETEFLDGVSLRRSADRDLTFKQAQVLRNIYSKL